MHRHHPYGGSGYDERRRSASPGPRFPRSDRGGPRGGGFGRGGAAPRGRGRGGNAPPYSTSGYSSYDSAPSYDTYNQSSYDSNSGYGGGGYSSYNAPAPPPSSYGRDGSYDSYAQGYGSNSYEDDAWRGEEDRGGPPQPRRRRDRDDRQHDAIIEDRINRERPCRTLFVRNIKYESDSNALRRQFEEHGLIRTFFDLISSRGMLFVTYYDLRAAQAARDRLQGMEVNGRPIDVHYSLPRPEETEGRVDREKHQGTLLVTLRDSRMSIDESEIQRKFSQFGDIKAIRSVDSRPDQRLVEMHDTRATEQIYDSLRQQPLQDGNMDLDWAWDILGDPVTDVILPPTPRGRDEGPRERPPRGRGRGFGGRGRGSGYDDYDRRDRSDNYNNYGPSSSRDYDDDRYGSGRGGSGGSGRGTYRGGPSGHVNGERGGYRSPNRQGSRDYPRNEQQPYNAGTAPPPPSGSTADHDRLEQARKVQQLLAALKNPAEAAAAAQGQAAAPTTAAGSRPPFVPGSAASYNPNPTGSSFATPPPNVTSAWNPPPSGGAPPAAFPPPAAATGAPASLGQLPPAVLALLQQTAQSQQAPHSSAPPYYGVGSQHAAPLAPTSYGTPQPPPGSSGTSGPTAPGVQNPQAMQQLLALLAAQQKR